MNMMSDIKDMVRHHHYQMSEILSLTPFDYNLLKLMIAQDLQDEISAMEKQRNG